MPKFFVQELSSHCMIEGENYRHIVKSLRMKEGEELTLCDGKGNDGEGFIEEINDKSLVVKIDNITKCKSEPNHKVTLFVSWPTGDKADLIVQKAVEIGAEAVVFVMTEFCVSKPKESEHEKKMTRLRKIAFEAACQSRRGIIPEIKGIISLKEAVNEMKKFQRAYMLYEGECESLRKTLNKEDLTLALFSGPEGGFSKSEADLCLKEGITPVSLGKRILRCETAPLTALSALLFYMEDMD